MTRVGRKQRQITETAMRLFRRYGFHRVTVEEICREAGVSKTTFYKHHANKTDLVKQIIEALTDDVLDTIEAIDRQEIPYIEKVRRLIDDRIDRTLEASDVFISELLHADHELADFVHQVTQRTQRRFLDFIAEGQAAGHVRPDVKLAFVLAILGKLGELAADDNLRRQYPDYAALTREIIDFFYYGLLVEHP